MRWTKPCYKTQTRTETMLTHMIRHMSKTRELTKNNAKAINWILTNKKFISALKGQTDQGHRGFMPRGKKKSSNTCCCCLVTKSHLTLCLQWSPPGSSVHGISQTRILEWVAISFSRGSSQLRDWTHISCTGRQILYHLAIREAQYLLH